MKKIVIPMVFAAALVGVAGCSSSSSSSSPSSSPATSSAVSTDGTGYTTQQEEQFLASFKQQVAGKGLTEQQIQEIGACAWRGIKAEIPYADFLVVDRDPNSAEAKAVLSKMSAIGTQCQQNPSAF